MKRLEKEYMTSKEAFNKQRIQDYIKQTNLTHFNKDTTKKSSTEFVWEAEPEGSSSSFPAKQSENSKEVCWKTSEEISRKDKLLTGIFQPSVRGKERKTAVLDLSYVSVCIW